MKQEEIMQLLENLYVKSIDGIPKVSLPIEQLADNYLSKNKNTEKAAKSFINYQVAKCTTSGFVTGLGGLITLPIAVPANVGSVLYVQIRMIACLAYMGGYDINSDQVQTLVYACLAGISVDQLIKKAGIEVGEKLVRALVAKIPGSVLTKINQKVGFRLVTKAGTKGVVNLTKMIPIVGGVVSGSFDLVETRIIAQRAYDMFIKGDITACGDGKDEPIDVEDDIEVEIVE